MNLKEKIAESIQLKMAEGSMPVEEAEVLRVIMACNCITQRAIARKLPHLGRHHEDPQIVIDSTTRKVRQIVRNLRINHKIPVLASTDGYYIPFREEQMKEYMERMERTARARAKASIETYEAMRDAAGVYSDYFERQLDLFKEAI